MAEPESLHDSVFIPLASLEDDDRQEIIQQYFAGDILRWAGNRALEYGDVIEPKVLYVEANEDETHSVAWVEHTGVNTATYEVFHNHHIVCDCVLCKNFNNGRGGIDTSLCEVMARAIEARGQMVGAKFRRDIVVSQNEGVFNVLTGKFEKSRQFDLESFAVTAIEQVLRSDKQHPEVWHGNAVSGSLSVEEASNIIELSEPLVLLAAEELRKSGKADFEGESLRLAA